MSAGTLLGGLLQLLMDAFFGNILRFLRHIRLPKEDRGRLSWGFVGTLTVIMIYGLVVLFSASYSAGYQDSGDLYAYIRPQLIIAMIGFAVMMLISNIDYRSLKYAQWPLYIIVLILLVVALFSPTINDRHRWVFPFGTSVGFTIQPSEIAKFSAMLCVACYTSAHYAQRKTLRHGIIGPGLPLIPFILLLLLEPHYSAIILMGMIIVTMLICGGCALRWFPLAIPVGAVGVAFMLTRKGNVVGGQRLSAAWGPLAFMELDASKLGYQMLHSLFAISSGELSGLGIGNSREKHQWLPESTNDTIFAVLCEELGFIGAAVCMLLFALLVIQGIMIALRSPDYFGMMLGTGIIAQIAWQVFFHIGAVTATTPNTGISLPFFSSGGTSLLVLLAQMGILLSISRAGNAAEERQRRQASEAAQRRVYRRETEGAPHA